MAEYEKGKERFSFLVFRLKLKSYPPESALKVCKTWFVTSDKVSIYVYLLLFELLGKSGQITLNCHMMKV